jgi:predicted ATPase
VYRLKGELLLRLPLPDIPQATACFHQALDVARRQQAQALELRAALSLSRLWQQQDERDQARQLLTAVYSWFTEGFETLDLQAAKALLKDLGT